MTTTAMFRVDPKSGLQYHRDAELLMKANAVAGVVFLLLGGVLALLVSLTRWPAVHLLNADWFYLTLTAHGLDMLVFWIIFFEIAVLYFCSSTLLRSRLATPRMAWLGFALMLIGAVTTNVAIFQGESSVMMTSYVPMGARPPFYLGSILLPWRRRAASCSWQMLVVAKAEQTTRVRSHRRLSNADGSHDRHLHHRLRRHHPDPHVLRATSTTSIR